MVGVVTFLAAVMKRNKLLLAACSSLKESTSELGVRMQGCSITAANHDEGSSP
jgi:hypothetical protein